MNILRSTALVAVGCLFASSAHATLGIFEHGTGIKSLGYGGVSYIGVEESTAISANPALTFGIGDRFDIGADILVVRGGTRISGNAAGPDEHYNSTGKKYFPIPQFGFSTRIGERWAFGVSAFAAGLGPDYPRSPYARFAQGQGADIEARSAVAQNTLKIAGIALTLAHEVVPGQSIGIAANLQHQSLSTNGTAPFAPLSESPEFVGDQGQHGGFGASVTVGWTGHITPWLDGALSYRSKTWQQKIEQYRGLLPDQGRLALPAIFGGALRVKLAPDWNAAIEYQHFAYQRSNAFGNSIGLIFEGRPLGSDNGPGFGWNNQNVYKLGVEHALAKDWTLRGGFIYSTQVLSKSNTFFNGLAPATPKFHLTGGFTYAFGEGSEFTMFGAVSDDRTVKGQNSIPAAFGGGEADINFQSINVGVSYGLRFGKPD